MIPKKNRLDKNNIELLFKKGNLLKNKNIIFKFLKEDNKENPKISFLFKKNSIKKAVNRNLLKRRGYFIISKYLKNLPNGFLGAFIFLNNSFEFFGGKFKKKEKAISLLEKEIKEILEKIK